MSRFPDKKLPAPGAVRQSVAECLARPAAEVTKPTQQLLRFEVGPGGVLPRCRVEVVDQYSFSAGQWWQKPSAAEPGGAADRAGLSGSRGR